MSQAHQFGIKNSVQLIVTISQKAVSLTQKELQPSTQIPRFLPHTSRTLVYGMVGKSGSCLSSRRSVVQFSFSSVPTHSRLSCVAWSGSYCRACLSPHRIHWVSILSMPLPHSHWHCLPFSLYSMKILVKQLLVFTPPTICFNYYKQ